MNNFFINQLCPKCGAIIRGMHNLCENCGEPLSVVDNKENNRGFKIITNNPKIKNRMLSAISYIGFLVIIPLFSKDKHINLFHINQGLSLFLCELIYFVLYLLINTILNKSIWMYSITAVMLSVMIVFVIYGIIGFISALKDENRQIPFIGNVRILYK